MELLSIVRARSIWLVDMQDLNPRGKHIESELIEWLRDNYHFSKSPSSVSDFDPQTKTLTLTQGSFQAREEFFISVDLNIYHDGLVADTRSSTKDADAFLEDVLNLAVRDFSVVYKPEMIRQKLYLSELNVRSERPLNSLNPKLHEFARRISSMLGTQNTIPCEFASIGFWPDPASTGRVSISNFQFERKANTPFSERRYYSRAPLHTDDHLKLLDEFEDLLVG